MSLYDPLEGIVLPRKQCFLLVQRLGPAYRDSVSDTVAVFDDLEVARDVREECYRRDFFEYRYDEDDEDADAYDNYRNNPAYTYTIVELPYFSKIPKR